MDPDVCLHELRKWVDRVLDRLDETAGDEYRAAELLHGLDGWLSAGGQLPMEWRSAG